MMPVLALAVLMSSYMLTLALQMMQADHTVHLVSEALSPGGPDNSVKSIPWFESLADAATDDDEADDEAWQIAEINSFVERLASEPPLRNLKSECGKALENQRAKRQVWRDIVVDNPRQHEDRNQIMVSPKYNISYVLNQKAGTRSFLKLFSVIDNSSYTVWMPYSNSAMLPDQTAVRTLAHTFLFTFIREPVAAAYSAYAEVSHRVPGIVSTPCDAGNRRYKEYLTRLADGTLRHPVLYHSWPEALKVDVLSSLGRQAFDFVGQLETASADLRSMLSKVGVPVGDIDRGMKSFEKKHAHPRNTVCDGQIEASHTSSGLDETTWPLICNLYYVDLVCLGYPVPEQCT